MASSAHIVRGGLTRAWEFESRGRASWVSEVRCGARRGVRRAAALATAKPQPALGPRSRSPKPAGHGLAAKSRRKLRRRWRPAGGPWCRPSWRPANVGSSGGVQPACPSAPALPCAAWLAAVVLVYATTYAVIPPASRPGWQSFGGSLQQSARWARPHLAFRHPCALAPPMAWCTIRCGAARHLARARRACARSTSVRGRAASPRAPAITGF